MTGEQISNIQTLKSFFVWVESMCWYLYVIQIKSCKLTKYESGVRLIYNWNEKVLINSEWKRKRKKKIRKFISLVSEWIYKFTFSFSSNRWLYSSIVFVFFLLLFWHDVGDSICVIFCKHHDSCCCYFLLLNGAVINDFKCNFPSVPCSTISFNCNNMTMVV